MDNSDSSNTSTSSSDTSTGSTPPPQTAEASHSAHNNPATSDPKDTESTVPASDGDTPKADEPEPEIFVENFEDKDKEPKSSGFFADLNASPDSMTKMLGLAGGVVAVALVAIFAIDMFTGNNADATKNLDLNKKGSQITPVQKQQQQQELPMPEVRGARQTDATAKASPTIPPKPTKASTPTATTAPTNTPQPTSAPTVAPTNTPEPTATTAPTPTTAATPTP